MLTQNICVLFISLKKQNVEWCQVTDIGLPLPSEVPTVAFHTFNTRDEVSPRGKSLLITRRDLCSVPLSVKETRVSRIVEPLPLLLQNPNESLWGSSLWGGPSVYHMGDIPDLARRWAHHGQWDAEAESLLSSDKEWCTIQFSETLKLMLSLREGWSLAAAAALQARCCGFFPGTENGNRGSTKEITQPGWSWNSSFQLFFHPVNSQVFLLFPRLSQISLWGWSHFLLSPGTTSIFDPYGNCLVGLIASKLKTFPPALAFTDFQILGNSWLCPWCTWTFC